ncbi:MAG: glycosyltransferase family 4 protein [Aggregatilineales bacterium]
MKRLLLFNLRTDADDHILGFTTRWINALAPHYDAIDVITMHAGHIDVADNVRVFSAGRERGLSKPRRFLEFYRILLRLLIQHHYTACFAHMTPLFAGMAGIPLTLRGVPTTLWYTHRQRTKQLELGTRLSRRVVSAVESSYPIQTPKLRPIGHGIDVDFYQPDSTIKKVPRRIVYVARLTAIKNQHILINTTADLDCELVLVGDIPDGFDDRYKQQLHAQVKAMNLQHKVTFAGAQTATQVRDWYRSTAIAVNLSPVGLFDKAPLEAMACAVPTIVSNPAFSSVTAAYQPDLHIPQPDDTVALKNQIEHLLALSATQRAEMGAILRQNITTQHSLEALVQKLVQIMETGEL